jgi:hypothetical protein
VADVRALDALKGVSPVKETLVELLGVPGDYKRANSALGDDKVA